MNFLELASKRRSIRAYKPDPIDNDLLMQVLEAGRVAPSACNFQPTCFIVLRGKKEISVLEKAYPRDWFLAAPVVIVVCCDRNRSWKRSDHKDYGDIDNAIAMDHMVLQAEELGLGTCWVGAFNKEETVKALHLPENLEPVLMTPLGFAVGEPDAKPRKKLEEIVRWGRY